MQPSSNTTQTLVSDLCTHEGQTVVSGIAHSAAGEPPLVLGGWARGRRLGVGGMGAVYEAVRAGRRAALKVLKPGAVEQGDFRARFEREVAVMGRISHPHVVGLIAAGVEAGWPWMALEYMPSGDLAGHLKRRGQMFEKEVVKIAIQIAEALEALHAAGLIHRDIKPANVFLDKTHGADAIDIRLGDLGMARSSDGDDRMTMTGTACGTPAYMAPEQIRGASDLDGRVDLYAVGATLFTLLTGHEPFTGGTIYVLTHAVLNEPLPNIRSANPQVSDALVAVIQKLCAKERSERYQSAADLRTDLERLRSGRQLLHVAGPSATRIFEELVGSPAPKPSGSGSGFHPTLGGGGGGGSWLPDLEWGRILRLGIPALIGILALWGISAWIGGRSGGKSSAEAAVPVPTTDAGGPVISGHLLSVPVRLRWVGPGEVRPGTSLTSGCWMLEDELANGLWSAVMGGSADDPHAPVSAVSMEEAEAFITTLAAKVPGLRPRLPTEAEWDRAASAVHDPETRVPPSGDLIGWWAQADAQQPALPELRQVVQATSFPLLFAPTAAGSGFRHMGGNLQEWVADRGEPTAPAAAGRDPHATIGSLLTLRGGSLAHPQSAQTPQTRQAVPEGTGEAWIGMRFIIPAGPEPRWPTGVTP